MITVCLSDGRHLEFPNLTAEDFESMVIRAGEGASAYIDFENPQNGERILVNSAHIVAVLVG